MLTRNYDELCNYCCEEDHEICFEFKPNSDCVCCADTVRLNSNLPLEKGVGVLGSLMNLERSERFN